VPVTFVRLGSIVARVIGADALLPASAKSYAVSQPGLVNDRKSDVKLIVDAGELAEKPMVVPFTPAVSTASVKVTVRRFVSAAPVGLPNLFSL